MKQKVPVPLITALLFFFLMTAVLLLSGIQQSGAFPGYPLDDVYIHMAIAKNFVTHGVWGITPQGFTSTTSSPLWTLLIASVYKIFDVNEWAPLALGLLACSGILLLAYHLLKQKFSPLRLTLLLLLLTVFSALPFLALLGMEHALHTLLTVGLMFYGVKLMYAERIRFGQYVALFLLAACLTVTRYEGMYLAMVLGLAFLLKKQIRAAVAIVTGSLFFISIYGLISLNNGWYFFPNTILLKGNLPQFNLAGMTQFLTKSIFNLIDTPQFFMLLLLLLMVYLWGAWKKQIDVQDKTLYAIFWALAVIHLQFSSGSIFSRYEMYLVLTGCVILIQSTSTFLPDQPLDPKFRPRLTDIKVAGILLLALPALQIAFSSGILFRDYPRAVRNIHDQQYQMGLFLQRYYNGETVAVNDIGLVSFLSETKVLDLWGLGNLEIAQKVLENEFYQTDLLEINQRYETDVVIIFDSWFRGSIPDEWIKVGEWEIIDNVVCGDSRVSFYAISPGTKVEQLTANLQDFSDDLPDRIIQQGLFIR